MQMHEQGWIKEVKSFLNGRKVKVIMRSDLFIYKPERLPVIRTELPKLPHRGEVYYGCAFLLPYAMGIWLDFDLDGEELKLTYLFLPDTSWFLVDIAERGCFGIADSSLKEILALEVGDRVKRNFSIKASQFSLVGNMKEARRFLSYFFGYEDWLKEYALRLMSDEGWGWS